MKTTGTIGIPVKRHPPVMPFMVAVGVMATAAGARILWQDLATGAAGASVPVRIQATAPASEDWGFVLRADTAQVLRHRPGLAPVGFVRTHAFGWKGPSCARGGVHRTRGGGTRTLRPRRGITCLGVEPYTLMSPGSSRSPRGKPYLRERSSDGREPSRTPAEPEPV